MSDGTGELAKGERRHETDGERDSIGKERKKLGPLGSVSHHHLGARSISWACPQRSTGPEGEHSAWPTEISTHVALHSHEPATLPSHKQKEEEENGPSEEGQ